VAEAISLDRFAGLIPPGALRALDGREWSASVLPGGRQVNLCLALDDGRGDRVVLRVRRGPELPGADFGREVACHRLAADAGLAPAIRAADAAAGWMIMEHVPGAHWTEPMLRDDVALSRLGERLRRLHALAAPDFAPVSDLALLRANCDVLIAHGEPVAEDLLRRGAAAADRLVLLPRRPPVPCHGDPDVANLLGPAPMLVDFEYAQIADPTYDLALLLAYYPALESRRALLQAAMGLDDDLSRQRLPLQIELCRLVGEAWTLSQRLLS
jgi:aminoglycoside phosphotransferase (APT) family kinase protein